MNDLAAIKVIKLEPGERTPTTRCLESYGCVAFKCDWELSRNRGHLSVSRLLLACPYCGVVIFMQSVQSDVEVWWDVAVRMPVYQSVEIIWLCALGYPKDKATVDRWNLIMRSDRAGWLVVLYCVFSRWRLCDHPAGDSNDEGLPASKHYCVLRQLPEKG